MKTTENIRHFASLLLAIEPTSLPLLLYYGATNVWARATGSQGFKEAVFPFRFGRFHVLPDRGDLGTIGEIFVQKPYQVMADFIPLDGDTCLDIGANIGCVSLQWRSTNKTGTIVAVEPHPVTFERMRANFELNEIKPIDCVQAAIGSRDGEVEILIDKHNNSMARVAGEHLKAIEAFQEHTSVTVSCLTLDSLMASKRLDTVQFLKIDVEGFEVECLRGATHVLTITEKVVLEYHSEELRQACTGILASNGFECEIGGSLLFARKRPH